MLESVVRFSTLFALKINLAKHFSVAIKRAIVELNHLRGNFSLNDNIEQLIWHVKHFDNLPLKVLGCFFLTFS